MRRALTLLTYLWIRDARLRDKKQNVKQYCVDQLRGLRSEGRIIYAKPSLIALADEIVTELGFEDDPEYGVDE